MLTKLQDTPQLKKRGFKTRVHDVARDICGSLTWGTTTAAARSAGRQGLTLVHVGAQLEQLQDTFTSQVGSCGGHKNSS